MAISMKPIFASLKASSLDGQDGIEDMTLNLLAGQSYNDLSQTIKNSVRAHFGNGNDDINAMLVAHTHDDAWTLSDEKRRQQMIKANMRKREALKAKAKNNGGQ